MKNTLAIAWRETRAYFLTPTAYVVGAMFLVLTGIFFVFEITSTYPEATVRGLIEWASFFIVFLAPMLTMRLISEEQKLGTLELLLTSPVRDWEVVLGKYIAALITLVVTILLTFYYVVLLYWFGDPDSGPIFTAYLGLIMYGAAALAVGLLASSLSSNQIVAAVVGTAALLTLSFLDAVADMVSGIAQDVLNGLSMDSHLIDFNRGVIDTSNLVYYVSMTTVILFVTVRVIEARRWS